MFNSSFAREMTDYLELRTAVLSASSASNDRRVLLLLDQYLVLSGFQGKELTEDILSAWSKTLSGKSKTVKEKLAVVRGFGKYLNTLGHQSFLPTLPNGDTSHRIRGAIGNCKKYPRTHINTNNTNLSGYIPADS